MCAAFPVGFRNSPSTDVDTVNKMKFWKTELSGIFILMDNLRHFIHPLWVGPVAIGFVERELIMVGVYSRLTCT